jgi:hypothetical protein
MSPLIAHGTAQNLPANGVFAMIPSAENALYCTPYTRNQTDTMFKYKITFVIPTFLDLAQNICDHGTLIGISSAQGELHGPMELQ